MTVMESRFNSFLRRIPNTENNRKIKIKGEMLKIRLQRSAESAPKYLYGMLPLPIPLGEAMIACRSYILNPVQTFRKTKTARSKKAIPESLTSKSRYYTKKSKTILENLTLKIKMSIAKSPITPTNSGQVEEKTALPIVAFTRTESFTQVAGKKIKAVAMAVAKRMK